MRWSCCRAGAPAPTWCAPAPSAPTSAPPSTLPRAAAPTHTCCWSSRRSSADGELVLRRVVGSDGRSRAWLNGQSGAAAGAARGRRAAVRDPRPARIPVAGAAPTMQRALVDALRSPRAAGGAGRRGPQRPGWRCSIAASRSRARPMSAPRDWTCCATSCMRSRRWRSDRRSWPSSRRSMRGSPTAADWSRRCARALDVPVRIGGPDRAGADRARDHRAAQRGQRWMPALQPLVPLLEEAGIRVKDASRTLLQYLDALEVDPQRAEADRAAAGGDRGARAQASHHQRCPAGAPGGARRRARAARQRGRRSGHGARPARRGTRAATRISRASSRRGAPRPRARSPSEISARMQELGMAGGRFLIDVSPPRPPSRPPMAWTGSSSASAPIPASRPARSPRSPPAASCRACRSRCRCAAPARPRGCMVFDEVDAGIGGAVAEIVGRELRALASARAGAVRDAPAAGRRPGPPAPARHQS